MSRRKTSIPEMMPQKQWLSKKEAMAFMDLGITVFETLVKNGELIPSFPTGGDKPYFSVKDINTLFERNRLLKQTA